MSRLKIAAVSHPPVYGDVSANLEQVERQVQRLKAQGADLVCFPEMNLTGFGRTPQIIALAQPRHGAVIQRLIGIAQREGAAILAGLPTQSAAAGLPYISQVLCTPQENCFVYHKAHLSQRETGLFSAGDDLGTLTWRAFGLGVQICHDTHFPEMSLAQASCGAQILLMPFASPMGDPQTLRARWLRFLPARAYDSGCYVVALNQCGMSPGGRRFASLIMAFNPDGELIAQWCSDQPGELIVEVDTQVVEAARCRRPFLQQRRPEIYRFERNTHA